MRLGPMRLAARHRIVRPVLAAAAGRPQVRAVRAARAEPRELVEALAVRG